MNKTVLASGDAGKLKELTAILVPLGLELIAQSALRIDSPPETGTTFLENALIKARHAARAWACLRWRMIPASRSTRSTAGRAYARRGSRARKPAMPTISASCSRSCMTSRWSSARRAITA